jgi:hypothetical protein
MGIGDIFSGAANAVGDTAVGLAHGTATVVTHLDDAARAAAWAANPTHFDDIGRGVAGAANYVAEHPGQVWDTGFEVGRYIVKDQLLDPQNLAINAAMLGATVATGGAAGGAWAAKLATMGRSAAGAIKGVRAIEEVSAAGKAIGAASAITRGLHYAEEAEDVASGVSKFGRVMGKVDRVLEGGPARRAAMRAKLSAKTGGLINEAGTAGFRTRQAIGGAIEGANPGLLRTIAGEAVKSTGLKPVLSEGASGAAKAYATGAWRTRRVLAKANQVASLGTAAEVGEEAFQATTNPMGYAVKKGKQYGADRYLRQKVGQAKQSAAMSAVESGSKGRGTSFNQQEPRTDTGFVSATIPSLGTSDYYGGAEAADYSPHGPSQVSEYVSTVPTMPMPGRRTSAFYTGTNETYART